MNARLLTASLISTLALAGTASADSISYLKDGNVWLSTGDGARQFQVTTDGGYTSASQADDGTIAAIKGQDVVKMDRFGKKLAQFTTPVSDGDERKAMWSYFEGPFDAE